jgi:hypothetical protein
VKHLFQVLLDGNLTTLKPFDVPALGWCGYEILGLVLGKTKEEVRKALWEFGVKYAVQLEDLYENVRGDDVKLRDHLEKVGNFAITRHLTLFELILASFLWGLHVLVYTVHAGATLNDSLLPLATLTVPADVPRQPVVKKIVMANVNSRDYNDRANPNHWILLLPLDAPDPIPVDGAHPAAVASDSALSSSSSSTASLSLSCTSSSSLVAHAPSSSSSLAFTTTLASSSSSSSSTASSSSSSSSTAVSCSADTKFVLKDAFHALLQITKAVGKTHSAGPEFCRCVTMALFKNNKADVRRVESVLQAKGLSFEDVTERYLAKRIRRVIPPPGELVKGQLLDFQSIRASHYSFLDLKAVFTSFSTVKDHKTQAPLWTEQVKNATESMLVHATKGCLSDPPGVTLYFKLAMDSDGLPLFKCLRGTNSVENLHQHLLIQLGQWNVGPELGNVLLLEKFTRHSIDVAARYHSDSPFHFGHYELYLIEQIGEITKRLLNRDIHPGFVSTAYYASTGEMFGVAPLYHQLGQKEKA